MNEAVFTQFKQGQAGGSDAALPVKDLIKPDAVHRRIYLDPEVFRAEMKSIYENNWVYVGHESEIPNTGDYKTTSIGLSPMIMSRDEAGTVHVMANRCRHRGATVCQNFSGNAKFFRCEYHAWTYGIDGDLKGVPYPGRYDKSFDRKEFGLQRVARVESYRGFVFACLNEKVKPLDQHLAGAKYYIDQFIDASSKGQIEAKYGAHRYGFDANWKFQLENSLDGYHPYFVHRSFFDLQKSQTGKESTMFGEKTSAIAKELGNGHAVLDQRQSMGTTYFDRIQMSPGGPDIIANMEREIGPVEAKRVLSATGGNGFNLAVFPNLVLIGVQIRTILPVSVNRTNVDVSPVGLVGVPDSVNQLRLRSHEAFFGPAGFGAPDDIEIFNRVQDGLLATQDDWILFRRGLGMEKNEGGNLVGEVTDETPQRTMYKEWLRLMTC